MTDTASFTRRYKLLPRPKVLKHFGGADGNWGTGTIKALQEFLVENGKEVDVTKAGEVNGKFEKDLAGGLQSFLVDDAGEHIEASEIKGSNFGDSSKKALQSFLLTTAGKDMVGDVDGKWGNSTTKALQTFLLDGLKYVPPSANVRETIVSRGGVDGDFGSATITALQQFLVENDFGPQLAQDGGVDGFWGPNTQRCLQQFLVKAGFGENINTGWFGSSGFGKSRTRALQDFLRKTAGREHLLDCAVTDGIWERGTTKALQAFLTSTDVPESHEASEDSKIDLKSPPEDDIVLNIAAAIHHVSNFDLMASTFNVDIAYTVWWKDPRIVVESARTGKKVRSDEVWEPELKILNLVEDSYAIDKGIDRINCIDGTVTLYMRYHIKLRTDYKLQEFPFDQQELQISMRVPRLLNQGIKDIEVHKAVFDPILLKESEFILVVGKDTPRSFRQDQESKEQTWNKYQNINEEPEYVVSMKIRRNPTYWLAWVVFPTSVCSLLGFNCFLMNIEHFNDRLTLIVTLLLTVVAVRFSVSDRLPNTPYLTFLDYWLLVPVVILSAKGLTCTTVFLLDTAVGKRELAECVDRWCSRFLFCVFVLYSQKYNVFSLKHAEK